MIVTNFSEHWTRTLQTIKNRFQLDNSLFQEIKTPLKIYKQLRHTGKFEMMVNDTNSRGIQF